MIGPGRRVVAAGAVNTGIDVVVALELVEMGECSHEWWGPEGTETPKSRVLSVGS
jgi:hypothetical protein